MSNLILKDNISMKDNKVTTSSHHNTLWARTKIIGGYDLYKDENGISQLGETVFEGENLVPLGGVQYAMESIFGVKGGIQIPTLNDRYGIGAIGSTITPSKGMPYPYGQRVCLFGVGTGGAAENNMTVLDIKYNEWDIKEMVPLRYTNDALSASDSTKYFGKKEVDNTTAYYLKKFSSEPVIHHLYKNGEDGEDGSEVDYSVWDTTPTMGIESFTECHLTISSKDVKEWFEKNGNIEMCRINSIGLFTAIYDEQLKDYANIQLFSKLNIASEPLVSTKDMEIIYRVYGA